MKRVVLLTFAVVAMTFVLAQAQGVGSVGIFSDAGATSCNIDDDAVNPKNVYIVNVNATGGSKGCLFALDMDPTITLSYVFDFSSFLKIGDALNGVSVAYGGCLTGDILALTVVFNSAGTSPACGLMSIVPDPTQGGGQVILSDCATQNVAIGPVAGQARVNADGTCLCNVPVQESSWGKIKALYNQ
jgi:hypothetical protein